MCVFIFLITLHLTVIFMYLSVSKICIENITRKQTHTNIKGKGYDNSQGSHKILIFMYIYLLFTYFKDVKRLPLSLFYLFIRLYTYYHPLNNFFLSSEKWSRVKKVMIMSFIIINKRKI